MATPQHRVQQFILYCAVPVLCSVCVGFVFRGTNVFDRQYSAFQFLWSAVVASVFYHLLLTARPRDAWAGLIILFGLTLVTTGSSRPAFVLRDIFYVAAIAASVLVYVRYFRLGTQTTFVYPAFVLAGIYGIVNIIALEINLWIITNFAMENTGGDPLSLATIGAFSGTLIGFAVGAGIAINEALAGRQRIAADLHSAGKPELPGSL